MNFYKDDYLNVNRIKFLFLIFLLSILLLPIKLWAQDAGEGLIVWVKHNPAGDNRNEKIENIMDRVAVMKLEQSGLKGVVIEDIPDEFSPELKLSCRYLQKEDMLKLDYRLQVAATGKRVAEIQVDTPVTHFLDREVANAVNELLHKSRDEIDRIARAKQEQNKQRQAKQEEMTTVDAGGTGRETGRERSTEQRRRRVEAGNRVSGVYMLGQTSEYLPYGLLMEGRLSFPLLQGEKMAWRLGGSLGVMRFSSAVNYKAEYVKTLVPLGLLTEVSLRIKSGWTFRLCWASGAAVRPTHDNETVDKLLAPALPYTNIGFGVQVPFISDKLHFVTGISGMGLFHLYEVPPAGKIKTETLLGINFDLGIVWRI
ncbi:MAG: hypothetical protein R6V67_07835 [Spirochaetia bacterium]